MTRTLFIMRHATAMPSTGEPDRERPLAPRGRRDAHASGARFADRTIDLVLCSTAVRTRETWAQLAEGGARAADVSYLADLYEATVDALLARVRAVPDALGTVLVIGHAPGMPGLVRALADRDRGDAWRDLGGGFPPGAIATIELEGDWADAGDIAARLVAFAGVS